MGKDDKPHRVGNVIADAIHARTDSGWERCTDVIIAEPQKLRDPFVLPLYTQGERTNESPRDMARNVPPRGSNCPP